MVYGAIQAIRIDRIHFEEKPRPDEDCPRCGTKLRSPRPGGRCRPCRMVLDFEENCARHGIDLASLADDEFVVIKAVTIDGVRAKRPIVVKDEEVAA